MSEDDKKTGLPSPAPAAAEPDVRTPNASGSLAGGIGAYGGNNAFTLDLSTSRWKKEHAENAGRMISDSPQGRLAIRTFSRGLLGAMFFSWGQRYAGAKMGGYHPDEMPKNWVQGIAKIFDVAAGRPIEATVNMLGGDGRRAVTFRPTRKFYGGQDGRSLGHEAVSVTFDFAAMSVGDALGRDIASLVDPNAAHSWKREDGSIDIPQAAKTLATNLFRYITYAQGEDWAVAIPYAYYLRMQRNMINKFSPGFGYDSDRGLNGGSFKVDNKGNVIGNYQLEGLLDLQGRFTAYNVGTLMFRETYTGIADRLLKWQHSGFTTESSKEADYSPQGVFKSTMDSITNLAEWATRDVVKGTLYMTPSVPFFWATRTPQTKWRGLYINPELGAIAYKSGPRPWPLDIDMVHVNERVRDTNKLRPERGQFMYTRESPVGFSKFPSRSQSWSEATFKDSYSPELNPHRHGDFDPFAKNFGTTDSIFNQVGKWNNQFRKKFHPLGYKITGDDPKALIRSRLKRDIDNYVNAAVSYTPYFWAKTEFANLWDNARMDMSIDRMLHGANKLNFGEFKAGLNEIWHSLRLEELPDEKREAEAKIAIENDVSAADVFNPRIFQEGYSKAPKGKPSPTAEVQTVTPSSTPTHGLLQDRPDKQTFVERLQLHKKYAENRMEAFKRETSPSYAAAVTPPKLTPPPAEPPSTFAEQEAARSQNTGSDKPVSPGTLH